MSLTVANAEEPSAPARRPKKWRWISILLVIIGLLVIAATFLWLQRYSFIEQFARDKLAAQGIDANLSVKEISKNRAVFEGIHLSSDQKEFFTAGQIAVSYKILGLRSVQFGKINVKAPHLTVEVDEHGKPISSWLPDRNAEIDNIAQKPSTPKLALPADGIEIEDGKVTVMSPYGGFTSDIDANIMSAEDLSAQFDVPLQSLDHPSLKGSVGGRIDVSVKGDTLSALFDLTSPNWTSGPVLGQNHALKGELETRVSEPLKETNSDITISYGTLRGTDIETNDGHVTWSGKIVMPDKEGQLPQIEGLWSAFLGSAGVTNADRRRRLAKKLTLNETLRSVAATSPFANDITQTIDDLLASNRSAAAGRLKTTETHAELYLTQTANLKSRRNSLLVSSPTRRPVVAFNNIDKKLTLAFNGDFEGPFATSLKEVELGTKLTDDYHLSHVEAFNANLQTKTAWRARTWSKRPVRIAPINSTLHYETTGDDSRLRVHGALGYDGDVSGGYAKGIEADGTLTLDLSGDDLTAQFVPRRGSAIKIGKLETASDWVVNDAAFSLKAARPQYQRVAGKGILSAMVETGQAQLAHKSEAQDVLFTLTDASISGHITAAKQSWVIKTDKVRMTSDTFPSAGTDINAKKAVLSADLVPDVPVSFTMTTPEANVKTQLVSAANLSLNAKGSPSNIDVTYGEGLIQFASVELPVLPMEGDVGFKNGVWSGQAVTFLPLSDNTPIFVDYSFENGIGTADVSIEDLPFAPGKLQPQQLVSALKGKISRVEGLVSTDIHLSFGVDTPLTSSGMATIKDMNAGTLPGPFKGLNGELTFSSFFPLQTDGVQNLTLDSFDAGFPLLNGDMTFEIIPDGIKIHAAHWPLGSGRVHIEPTTWLYSAEQNRVSVKVENVALGEFLKDVGGGKFSATGDVSGHLPVLIEGVKVHVEGGSLLVEDGGIIQYSSPQTDAASAANQYASYAFEALKHFDYDKLEAELNGPLDGPMRLSVAFGGSNPEVLYGTEFKFDVGVEGELLNIMRSFKVGEEISEQIYKDLQDNSGS